MPSSAGTINKYHLNSDVKGRGVCIRMNPAIPGSGWACVWKDNPLYEETTALFLESYALGKPCSITWSADRGGIPEIVIAESP
jgi:hypothetical protein